MIFFRGWGWIVFFAPLLIWTILLFLSSDHKDVLPSNFDIVAYWAGALALALTAVLLWFISRYRSRVVAPGHDHFSYIPLKYWVYVLAAAAVGVYIASFFATTS